MTSMFGVLACGLAAFTCQRFEALPWNVLLAVIALASPFVPLPATAAAAGLGLALAIRGAVPRISREPAVLDGQLAIGRNHRGGVVRIPLRRQSGAHALIVGATGSGKTVTEAWLIASAIEHDRRPEGRSPTARGSP
jgi:hypothetical protein